MTTIDFIKTLQMLAWLKVETGSLACLGCEYEDHCSTKGCAILRNAEKHLKLAMATQSFLECRNCEHWRQNDPRCMCDKSPYAGRTVRPDNCCSCISVDMLAASEAARSDLARQLASATKELHETKSDLEAAVRGQETLQKALAEVKAERSWISVNDKFPGEEAELVLAVVYGKPK